MCKKVCVLAGCAILLMLVSCVSTLPADVPVAPAETENGPVTVVEPEPAPVVSTIPYPAALFNAGAGTPVYADKAGDIIYASGVPAAGAQALRIPDDFADSCMVLSYDQTYFYHGKKCSVPVQVIYFNVQPASSFRFASPERPVTVEEGDVLGMTKEGAGVVIRTPRPDEYFVNITRKMPRLEGSAWYFGVEAFLNTTPKHLLFQPVTSRTDSITFSSDGLSETLEEITCYSTDETVPCLYPTEGVRIKTVLEAYPETTTPQNKTEWVIRSQYLNGMNLDVTLDFDGLTWHIMFPDHFKGYFEEEYTLGDDIWLFANIVYSLDGQLYLYGRDYTLYDVEPETEEKKAYIIAENMKALAGM